MPIGRFNVRNEYGLGVKELYKDGVESEDPKVVIDGVAIAGLVGLLRQLGDLSQFAAEVFHDLQEQVACTFSRSRKLVTRIQRVEASLPSLEKAILSQTSHIHFAYSPGSEWHPRIKNEQNHFICDDLPHFIMDSYEECHDPPRLQLLDRFDMGGPGSCVKRYSDPTFFRRASNSSEACNKEKSLRERKARKIKKRSQNRREKFPNCVPISNNSESIKVCSKTSREESSLSHTGSTFDKSSRSDRGDQSDFVGSKVSIQPIKTNIVDTTVPPCSDVTWDEKLEILQHMSMNFENNQRAPEKNHYLHQKDMKPVSAESIDQVADSSENGSIAKSMDSIMNVKLIAPTEMDYLHEGLQTFDAKNSRVDQLSEVTSCTESDADGNCRKTTIDKKFVESNGPNYIQGQDLNPINTKSFSNMEGLPEHGSSSDSNSHEKYPTTILDWGLELNQKDSGIGEVQEVDETNFDRHEHDVEPFPQVTNFSEGQDSPHEDKLVLANPDSFPQLKGFHERENSLKLIDNGNLMGDSFDRKLRIGDVQYMIDTIENKKWAIETIKAEPIDSSVAQVRELISDAHYMHETNLVNAKLNAGTINENLDGLVDGTSIEEVNNANLIEWPHHEDIDSETDNFVDALYTIDSESESEHETRKKRGVESLAYKCQLGDASTNPVVDKIDHSEPEDNPFGMCDGKDEVYDGLEKPTSSAAPLPKLEYLENGGSSHHSEAATSQEEQSPKSLSTVSLGIEVCANTDETRLGNLEWKGSGETPFGSTDSYPHAFWSNGTLFGLQPSKPTVINMLNSAPISSGNCNIVDPCISKVDDPGKTMSSSVNNYDDHADNIDSNSQGAGLLKTYTKFLDHDEKNTNHDSTVPGLVNGHVTIPKSHDLSSADLKNVNFEATNGIGDRSSLLSLLGHNLLKNSLRRSRSLDYDDMNKPNDVAVSDTVPRSHFNGELQSSINSPPPSPPLELMKISFRPVDGFETSKLQLKYPERTDNHEITVDTFPSFQLVPESTRLPHDMGSDSDNDTFCRSYPCASDDSVSHLSDSDSEQWESGDIIESNNHAFYDGFCGMSSTESASSSSRHENTDQQSMHSGSRNFLSSDPTSQLSVLGTKNNFELQDLTPQLPPLPPLQWCVSRPVLNEPENKPSSAVFETAEDDLAKLQSRMRESETIVKDRKVTKAKVDDQKQNSPAADGRTMDEHGDFLHQIRTKSFNLKRTDAARSPHSPSPAPCNKVTAILQKASAICKQAVGSDDDSWSDT